MGKMVSFTNTSKGIRHIGNKTLWPGDTREVEVEHLEADERKKYQGPVVVEPAAPTILAILENNITVFTLLIAEKDESGAYIVSEAQLDELNDGEQAAQFPRKGIAEAIAVEKLDRADAKVETSTEKFVATLNDMDLKELHDQFEVHAEDAGSLAIVENVWREKLTELNDDGRIAVLDTLADGSRQAEILNEVIAV